MRDYVPQCSGIYTSNRDEFSFLLIQPSNPCEQFNISTYPCDGLGVVTGRLTDFTAADFGDCVYLSSVTGGEYE